MVNMGNGRGRAANSVRGARAGTLRSALRDNNRVGGARGAIGRARARRARRRPTPTAR